MRLVHPAVTLVLVCVAGLTVLTRGQNAQTTTPPAQAAAAPAPLRADAPFTVAVATAVVEAAPVYMVAEGPFGKSMQYINGGVRTLANSGAHAAGNATTQMLVVIRDNPKVRLLFTLTEGLYRIVAKRSSGITTLADLKGKRIVVPRSTSANYYLVAMLRSAGLQESDVTLVNAPATAMAAALVKGDADAISMWEPESQNAVAALGQDAVIFQNNRIYREFYSIYSTTDVMNDPRRRAQLVEFVRALDTQTNELKKDPRRFFPLISRITKHPEDQIARGWEHHAFPFNVPGDMLDIITEEEKWVAALQQRAPRTRTELAGFIDTSILKEALGR
jgi:ABC-type nitrate/sulfonate/bicarbonate transport system substrate-binding protein